MLTTYRSGDNIGELYFNYTNEFFLCIGPNQKILPISFTVAKYWAQQFGGKEIYQEVIRLNYVYMRNYPRSQNIKAYLSRLV